MLKIRVLWSYINIYDYNINVGTVRCFAHKAHMLYFVNLCCTDSPDLLITFEPSMLIYEGSSLRLCCLSNNSLPNETISWLNTNVGREDGSTACLHFVKISRNDSGIYTCKAEHEGQKITANTTLKVLSKSFLFFHQLKDQISQFIYFTKD